MKLRKFTGVTSRAVLEQIRAELGPDALIIANRATSEGIEITAMSNEAIPALPQTPETSGQDEAGVAARSASASLAPADPSARPERPMAASSLSTAPDALASTRALPSAKQALAPESHAPADERVPAEARFGPRLIEEVAAVRALIEEQLAVLTLSDALRRSPLRARLLRELLGAGYSAERARALTQHLPDDFTPAQARTWLLERLTRELRCIDAADDIVTRGGIYALTGPTGVGKTTTTAKLAARCAVRHGASSLALVTTDSYRVGAHDQLRIYARILGVPVYTVSERADLAQALESMRGKHLVLIDTVGIGQRDRRVAEQTLLLAHPGVRRLLLLNAATQAETLEEVVVTYARGASGEASALAGAVVTKLDEAARVAPVLDATIRHGLPIHYVTIGQRVPEDIGLPSARYLIERSLRGIAKPSPFALTDDEATLVGAIGGATHG
jgi:flagellar biosynthesis protein FlhF